MDTSFFTRTRSFTVYRWRNDLTLKTNTGEIYSGWAPWLHYSCLGKWTKYNLTANHVHSTNIGNAMIPAHIFFKEIEDFKKWVSEEEFNMLLVNVL